MEPLSPPDSSPEVAIEHVGPIGQHDWARILRRTKLWPTAKLSFKSRLFHVAQMSSVAVENWAHPGLVWLPSL